MENPSTPDERGLAARAIPPMDEWPGWLLEWYAAALHEELYTRASLRVPEGTHL